MLRNIPPTNFSANFYISNPDTENWLDNQRDGDEKLLLIDTIDSPIRNYTNLLSYLKQMKIKIIFIYFTGTGFAEVSCLCFFK